ncbi:MAG: hypothetical protein K2X03_13210 [Bryobacteraceae bacterium]|nr:hypothetical protein [Bryobacteraceae bacterium]
MYRLPLLFALSFALLADGKPDGEWSWRMASPFGELKAKAVMKSEDGKLTGAFWLNESRKLEIEDGKVDGAQVSFTLKRQRPDGGTMTYKMTGKVDGDKIDGKAEAVEMSATQAWSAERNK